MSKNKYAKGLCAGLAGLVLVACNSCTKPEPKTQKSAYETHSLTSVSDPDSKINEDLAEKIRKISEFIVLGAKRDNPESDPDSEVCFASSRFEHNGKGYAALVVDIKIHEGEPIDLYRDSIIVCEISFVKEGIIQKLTFYDDGLDGNLNGGIRSISKGNSLFPAEEESSIIEEVLEEIKYENSVSGEKRAGLEHKEYFQKEFLRVINEIIDYCGEGQK